MVSPLRQSPDDPPVATAEPEATAGAAPEGDQPEPVVAAPAAVQEPSTEESGASGTEDEAKPEEATPDPRSQMAEVLKSLRAEHPDIYDSVYSPEERERLQGGQEERGEEVALERGQLNRQKVLTEAQQAYLLRDKDIEESGSAAVATLKAALAQQVQEAEAGRLAVTSIAPNVADLTETIKAIRNETRQASFGYAAVAFDSEVQDMLASHTSRRYLTPEDQKRIDDAPVTDKLRVRIHAQLDAAIKRGSTAEVKLAAKAEAEETLGLTEKLKTLQAFIPANGATNTLETGGAAKDSRSDAEILSAEDTPVEKLMEIRSRQRKAGG